mmetsp:Transcript_39501/g.86140  ORF Transcript_39501/g.86140 Transcript_39501/m.86140 type:complete len:307 (+) Transcript_39501:18-938(+)
MSRVMAGTCLGSVADVEWASILETQEDDWELSAGEVLTGTLFRHRGATWNLLPDRLGWHPCSVVVKEETLWYKQGGGWTAVHLRGLCLQEEPPQDFLFVFTLALGAQEVLRLGTRCKATFRSWVSALTAVTQPLVTPRGSASKAPAPPAQRVQGRWRYGDVFTIFPQVLLPWRYSERAPLAVLEADLRKGQVAQQRPIVLEFRSRGGTHLRAFPGSHEAVQFLCSAQCRAQNVQDEDLTVAGDSPTHELDSFWEGSVASSGSPVCGVYIGTPHLTQGCSSVAMSQDSEDESTSPTSWDRWDVICVE